MLTQEEDVEIHALRKQGWSISAITRHTGRDRKTVRAYLNGDQELGVRQPAGLDPFDRFEPYVRQRLSDDRHVWATVLFHEVAALGYDQAYPTFTPKLRERELRPRGEACEGVKGRAPSTSSIPRARRSSGTGTSWGHARGIRRPRCSCWWGRCRIRPKRGAG